MYEDRSWVTEVQGETHTFLPSSLDTKSPSPQGQIVPGVCELGRVQAEKEKGYLHMSVFMSDCHTLCQGRGGGGAQINFGKW